MRTQLIIILSLLNVCLVPAQERDTRVRTYITPTRIVWQQDSDHITNCNFLLNQGDGQAYWGAYYDYESIDTGLQGKKEKTVKAATYLLPMGLVQLFCLISVKNFMAEYN